MPSAKPFTATDRTTVSKSSFNGGLISPLMGGRTDFSRFKDSCTELKNFIPWVTGAVKKRAGSIYVNDCKYDDKITRLLPFKFNQEQNFVIEFGKEYFRFYFNGAVIKNSDGSPYEISHTINEEYIKDVSVIQNGDHLFFAHIEIPLTKLVREGHTDWKFETVSVTNLDGNNDVWGNPAAICFFENRLWLAGSKQHPQGIAGSNTGDYFNFKTTNADNEIKDDTSVRFTINSPNNNRIKWLFTGRDMVVGTTGDEFVMTGGSTGITPFNVSVRTYTSYGSVSIQPVKIDNKTMFVQTGGAVVREFGYLLKSDGYTASNVTILTENITRSGIKEMLYQQQPNTTLWVLMNDGRMAGLIRNDEHNVMAWFETETSNLISESDSVPQSDLDFGFGYKSMTVIPDWKDSREDILWNVVRRYVNDTVKQFIEYTPSYSYDNHAVFVDSSLKYDSTPTNKVSGLEHLEGQKVAIYADGGVVPSQKVVDGELDFDNDKYSVVVVGIPYNTLLVTTPFEIGENNNIIQGYKSKIVNCMFNLHRSAFEITYSTVEVSGYHWETEVFKVIGDTVLGQNDNLFTGNTVRLPLAASQQSNLKLAIKHNKPGPFTLLSIMTTIQVTSV